MSPATTAVLYAPGTNCHEETAAAIELAGGRVEVVLLHDLLDGTQRLNEFQAAVIPGGFSFGDHLGAGRVFATLLVARLCEASGISRYGKAFARHLQRVSGPFGGGGSAGEKPGKTIHGVA